MTTKRGAKERERTPKQRVLAKFPRAFSTEAFNQQDELDAVIVECARTCNILGVGNTARAAWAAAARKVKGG